MLTLDNYDGESWTAKDLDGSEGVQLSVPATLPWSGDGPPPGGETLDQTFRILADLGFVNALPMAQTAEEIVGPFGDITWDPARSVALIDSDLGAGATYTVRSRIVVPTPGNSIRSNTWLLRGTDAGPRSRPTSIHGSRRSRSDGRRAPRPTIGRSSRSKSASRRRTSATAPTSTRTSMTTPWSSS